MYFALLLGWYLKSFWTFNMDLPPGNLDLDRFKATPHVKLSVNFTVVLVHWHQHTPDCTTQATKVTYTSVQYPLFLRTDQSAVVRNKLVRLRRMAHVPIFDYDAVNDR